jgi:histidinol-phosphate aminotransferase
MIEDLVRKNILTLKPYTSARNEYSNNEGIFLDANENSFGSIVNGQFNRYPDPMQKKLKEKIAALKQVKLHNIFLGNGSDEAIDLLIRIFCEPGSDSILIMPPTYGMYSFCAMVNNVQVKEIQLTNDFQINTAIILDSLTSNTKIIFICSPNNPTGNLFSEKDIEQILINFSGIVVIDEAYIDFSDNESWITKIKKYPSLVVLQTFSKAWGLANLRIGMAFAQENIITLLNQIKYPYNVNGYTQQIAIEVLENITHQIKIVEEIKKEKMVLSTGLKNLLIVKHIFPSEANFILVRFKDAAFIYKKLIKHNIIVRNRSNLPLCENCLRITIGTAEQNRQLITVLREGDHK